MTSANSSLHSIISELQKYVAFFLFLKSTNYERLREFNIQIMRYNDIIYFLEDKKKPPAAYRNDQMLTKTVGRPKFNVPILLKINYCDSNISKDLHLKLVHK